jgi:hypothetical protein
MLRPIKNNANEARAKENMSKVYSISPRPLSSARNCSQNSFMSEFYS